MANVNHENHPEEERPVGNVGANNSATDLTEPLNRTSLFADKEMPPGRIPDEVVAQKDFAAERIRKACSAVTGRPEEDFVLGRSSSAKQKDEFCILDMHAVQEGNPTEIEFLTGRFRATYNQPRRIVPLIDESPVPESRANLVRKIIHGEYEELLQGNPELLTRNRGERVRDFAWNHRWLVGGAGATLLLCTGTFVFRQYESYTAKHPPEEQQANTADRLFQMQQMIQSAPAPVKDSVARQILSDLRQSDFSDMASEMKHALSVKRAKRLSETLIFLTTTNHQLGNVFPAKWSDRYLNEASNNCDFEAVKAELQAARGQIR